MNTVAAKNRLGTGYYIFAAAVIAVVVLIVLVLRWAMYGPYYNAHPVKDAEIRGQLVGLVLREISDNWEAELILGDRNIGGRGGDTFEVTIPEDMVLQTMGYLTNGATMIIHYYSPSFYMRRESYSGNIATSIETAK